MPEAGSKSASEFVAELPSEIRESLSQFSSESAGLQTKSSVWQKIFWKESQRNGAPWERWDDQNFLNVSGLRSAEWGRRVDRKLGLRTAKDLGKIALGNVKHLFRTFSDPAELGVSTWERNHLFAIAFLRSAGLLSKYLEFLEEKELFSDVATVRHFYYAYNLGKLLHHARMPDAGTVMEIGGGSGSFITILYWMTSFKKFYVVDLPEMLAFAAYNVNKWIPEAEIVFGNAGVDADPARPTFVFLTPDQIDQVPDASVNLSLNFSSFMEMDSQTLNRYFGAVYRCGKPGSMHYNSNRVQPGLIESNGRPFYNHPLLYPYQSDDLVLVWDIDPVQQVTRAIGLTSNESTSFVRCAIIQPNDRQREKVVMTQTQAFHLPNKEMKVKPKPVDKPK